MASNVTDKSKKESDTSECDSVQQISTALSNLGLLQEGALVFKNKTIRWISRKDLPFTPQRCYETDSLRSDIRQSLSERYSQLAHVYLDGYEPVSYCYYEQDESTKRIPHFPVKVVTLGLSSSEMFPPEEMKWFDLQKEGNIKLHSILNLPISLWYNLQYDNDQWVPRRDTDIEHFSVLETYGRKTGHASVQQCLSEGLTKEDMEPLFSDNLLNYWRAAMINGMTNGEGRTAVFELFSDVAKLLPHVNITTPVMIYHMTSSLRHEGFLISESSSSCSTEEKAKVKLSGKSKRQSKKHRDEIESESEDPKVHRHYVDLEVACLEEATRFAKYIALIEVHSRGKTDVEAENKFLTEMISALQAQSSVFGFLFSREYATVYHAERVSRRIKISKMVHDLLDCFSSPTTVNVGNFQMLIMDIFSCLVVGVENITT